MLAVIFSNLNSFSLQTRRFVLWSPGLVLRVEDNQIATAKVNRNEIRFASNGHELIGIRRRVHEPEPDLQPPWIGLALARSYWEVIDPVTENTLGNIQRDGVTSRWVITVAGKPDCTIQEQTCAFGRLLDRKWLKSYVVLINEIQMGTIREQIYPFGQKLRTNLNGMSLDLVDPRLVVAIASIILLSLNRSLAGPIP